MSLESNIISVVAGRDGLVRGGQKAKLIENIPREFLLSGILRITTTTDQEIKKVDINYLELLASFKNNEWQVVDTATFDEKEVTKDGKPDLSGQFCDLENKSIGKFSGYKIRIFADRLQEYSRSR